MIVLSSRQREKTASYIRKQTIGIFSIPILPVCHTSRSIQVRMAHSGRRLSRESEWMNALTIEKPGFSEIHDYLGFLRLEMQL
jgi:hypothetical protein